MSLGGVKIERKEARKGGRRWQQTNHLKGGESGDEKNSGPKKIRGRGIKSLPKGDLKTKLGDKERGLGGGFGIDERTRAKSY